MYAPISDTTTTMPVPGTAGAGMDPAKTRVFRPSGADEGVKAAGAAGGVPAGTWGSSVRFGTDACARKVRDEQNEHIAGRVMNNWYYEPLACDVSRFDSSGARVPTWAYDHPSLRVNSIGVGAVDSCLIDRYNTLRADPAAFTRDRCREQHVTRIFRGVPALRPGGSIDESNRLVPQVSNDAPGAFGPCSSKKQLSELEYPWKVPLLPSMRAEYDPARYVEPFVRGGDTTRRTESYTTTADARGCKLAARAMRTPASRVPRGRLG